MRRNHHARLLEVFAPLVGLSVAACDEPDPRRGFDESLCDGKGSVVLARELSPREPVDYVALRRSWETDHTIVDESGSACAGGSAQCEQMLAGEVDGGLIVGQDGSSLNVVTTTGDSVTVFTTVSEVREFLGDIDTPSEAALLAVLSGFRLDCEGPNLVVAEDGFLIYGETGTTCGSDVVGHRLAIGSDGRIDDRESSVVEEGDPNCAIGRIPCGLRSFEKQVSRSIGGFYARVAHLEAAAVHAFAQLARELAHHGAPEDLQRRARRSRRDEQRHALMTAAVAARYGARPQRPEVAPVAVRSLFEIALDNAREGLLRETFGAAVAHHQARHATDPLIRRISRSIAADETRHAALSWDLHDWLKTQLTRDQLAQIHTALAHDLDHFSEAFCREPHADAQRLAGLPGRDASRRLFEGLRRDLWEPASTVAT